MEFPIKIIVKSNSKKEEIEYDDEKNIYIVYVKSPAKENKANMDVIKLISKFSGKPVKIIKVLKNKIKIIDIL